MVNGDIGLGGIINLREEIDALNEIPIQDQDIEVETTPITPLRQSAMFDLNQ
jgi:hypothetical protein